MYKKIPKVYKLLIFHVYSNQISISHYFFYSDTNKDCVTKDARAYNVMNNFKRINSTIVHAELFGFRFSPSLGGDASDVTISCSVKICTSASGPCTSVSSNSYLSVQNI